MKRALSRGLAILLAFALLSVCAFAVGGMEDVDWFSIEKMIQGEDSGSSVSGGEDPDALPSDTVDVEEEPQEEEKEPEDPFDPIWPCDSWRITTYCFYWQGGNVTRHGTKSNQSAQDGHINALDIAGKGTRIYAVESGTVLEAGNSGEGFGYRIIIEHENGLRTLYAHLKAGSLTVKAGDTVARGRQIAVMGNSGGDYGVHLHFEMYGVDEKGNFTLINPFRRYYESKYRSVLRLTRETVLAAEKVLKQGWAAVKGTSARYWLTKTVKENLEWYLETVRKYYTYDEKEKQYYEKNDTALPSVTAVTPTRPTAHIGETVTFTIGEKGAVVNYLRIRRNGTSSVLYFETDKTAFIYCFAQAGTYTIEADSWNGAGLVHFRAIEFTVTE